MVCESCSNYHRFIVYSCYLRLNMSCTCQIYTYVPAFSRQYRVDSMRTMFNVHCSSTSNYFRWVYSWTYNLKWNVCKNTKQSIDEFIQAIAIHVIACLLVIALSILVINMNEWRPMQESFDHQQSIEVSHMNIQCVQSRLGILSVVVSSTRFIRWNFQYV
jgi:hypothetical protein